MRAFAALAAGVVLLMIAPAQADMINVPVSGMSGDYFDSQGGIERSADFTFTQSIANIYDVRVRVTGLNAGSTRTCLGVPWQWPFFFDVEIHGGVPGTGYSTTFSPGVDGAYVSTFRLGVLNVSNWGFLLDGTGTIRIGGHNYVGSNCVPAGPPPEASIATVEVHIYGDVSTPVEPTSWGRIKALYR